jgi:hypothetical protein
MLQFTHLVLLMPFSESSGTFHGLSLPVLRVHPQFEAERGTYRLKGNRAALRIGRNDVLMRANVNGDIVDSFGREVRGHD